MREGLERLIGLEDDRKTYARPRVLCIPGFNAAAAQGSQAASPGRFAESVAHLWPPTVWPHDGAADGADHSMGSLPVEELAAATAPSHAGSRALGRVRGPSVSTRHWRRDSGIFAQGHSEA